MRHKLIGPNSRYSIHIEAYVTEPGGRSDRFETDEGLPCSGIVASGDQMRPAFDAVTQNCLGYLVRLGNDLSFWLDPLESGLLVRSASLMGGGRAVVTARVQPGAGAPESLTLPTSLVLLEGDATEIGTPQQRYLPFRTEERSDTGSNRISVDRLAVAMGRSITRANAVLAAASESAGVTQVAEVSIRVGIMEYEVHGQDRVILLLPQPGEAADQYIELSLRTAPNLKT